MSCWLLTRKKVQVIIRRHSFGCLLGGPGRGVSFPKWLKYSAPQGNHLVWKSLTGGVSSAYWLVLLAICYLCTSSKIEPSCIWSSVWPLLGPHHPLQRQSPSHVSASSVPTRPLPFLSVLSGPWCQLFSLGADNQHCIEVICQMKEEHCVMQSVKPRLLAESGKQS